MLISLNKLAEKEMGFMRSMEVNEHKQTRETKGKRNIFDRATTTSE